MKALLRRGSSAESNEFILTVMGENGHPRAFCNNSTNSSPCLEIKVWYSKEVGDGNGGDLLPFGKLDRVTNSGVISGWASDRDEPDQAVGIEIYVGGRKGQGGTFIGETTANRAYSSVEISGNVGFSVQLPNQYLDGQARIYYVYGVDTDSGQAEELRDSGKSARAFAVVPAARDFYNDNVLTAINGANCSGCHALSGFEYDNALFQYILSPPPPSGNRTNFRFYEAMNGVNHAGGAYNGIRDNLAQVWDRQFQ